MSQFINFRGTSALNESILAKFSEIDGELYWDNQKVNLGQFLPPPGLPNPSNVVAYFNSANASKKVLDTSGGRTSVLSLEDEVNGHIVSQAEKQRQPTNVSNAQNGKDSMLFTFLQGMLNNSSVLAASNYPDDTASIIVAVNLSSGSSSRAFYNILQTSGYTDIWWRYNLDGKGYIGEFRSPRINEYPSSMPLEGNHIISIRSGASEYEVRIDGVSQGIRTPSFNRHSIFILNRYDTGINGFIYGCMIRRGDVIQEVIDSEIYINEYWGLDVL